MITIRQFKPGDWKDVKTLRLRALRDSPQAFTETLSEATEMSDSMWKKRIEQNSEGKTSYGVLASDHDKLVGMAVGLRDQIDIPKAQLVAMWVSPDYRGKGIAKSLVESISAWAKDSGCQKLVTCVTVQNAQAKHFYTKMGFDLLPDQNCNEIHLQLPLNT